MEDMKLHVAMQAKERTLLESFLRCSTNYLEFGAGGSTVLAAELVKLSVTSVDSSAEFLDRVRITCSNLPLQPKLVLVDVGPIGDLGYPKSSSTKELWPGYYNEVWKIVDPAAIDLCLVDGRFRVACFLTTILRCPPSTLVAVHDFSSREKYHVIKDFSDEIARASDLSIFRRKRTVPDVALAKEIEKWSYDQE